MYISIAVSLLGGDLKVPGVAEQRLLLIAIHVFSRRVNDRDQIESPSPSDGRRTPDQCAVGTDPKLPPGPLS